MIIGPIHGDIWVMEGNRRVGSWIQRERVRVGGAKRVEEGRVYILF